MNCQRCFRSIADLEACPLPHWCYSCLVSSPMEWCELANKAMRSKYQGEYWYLITFTRNPNSKYDKKKWLSRIVDKELSRSCILQSESVLEHLDTNVHCHSYCQLSKPIAKSLFSVFSRDYGYVDVRRIKVNNGVEDYITKDRVDVKTFKRDEILKNYLDLM